MNVPLLQLMFCVCFYFACTQNHFKASCIEKHKFCLRYGVFIPNPQVGLHCPVVYRVLQVHQTPNFFPDREKQTRKTVWAEKVEKGKIKQQALWLSQVGTSLPPSRPRRSLWGTRARFWGGVCEVEPSACKSAAFRLPVVHAATPWKRTTKQNHMGDGRGDDAQLKVVSTLKRRIQKGCDSLVTRKESCWCFSVFPLRCWLFILVVLWLLKELCVQRFRNFVFAVACTSTQTRTKQSIGDSLSITFGKQLNIRPFARFNNLLIWHLWMSITQSYLLNRILREIWWRCGYYWLASQRLTWDHGHHVVCKV